MHRKDEKSATMNTVIASGAAGFMELGIFHPVDTMVKRLQRNSTKVTTGNLKHVIFGQTANYGKVAQFKSLYQGMFSGVFYKVSQRVFKFTAQKKLDQKFQEYVDLNSLGSYQNIISKGLAGSVAGIAEASFLLPLDVLKIRNQTRTLGAKISYKGLYDGYGVTAFGRNAPGSFALFAVPQLITEKVFNKTNREEASTIQNLVASTGGAFSSLIVSSPGDVIKTRMQAQRKPDGNYQKISVRDTASAMYANEGVLSFFKGMGPKSGVAAAKLVFFIEMMNKFSGSLSSSAAVNELSKHLNQLISNVKWETRVSPQRIEVIEEEKPAPRNSK